jgi:hypothetical protein
VKRMLSEGEKRLASAQSALDRVFAALVSGA